MALETRNGGGNVTYLALDYGKKGFYINSKEEKEGFEKHVNSKGSVSYRQPVGGIVGKITGAFFRDSDFGKQFTLNFEDEGERYSVSIGIEDSVFMNIARSVNNIDVSKKVRLSVYPNPSKKTDKVYFGTSLSYPDELNDEGKAKLVEWGEELPAGKQLNSGKWSFVDQNEEAYNRVAKFITDNGFDKQQPTADSKPDEKKAEVKKTESKPAKEDEESDLPF